MRKKESLMRIFICQDSIKSSWIIYQKQLDFWCNMLLINLIDKLEKVPLRWNLKIKLHFLEILHIRFIPSLFIIWYRTALCLCSDYLCNFTLDLIATEHTTTNNIGKPVNLCIKENDGWHEEYHWKEE